MSEKADRAAAAEYRSVVLVAEIGHLPAVRGFVHQNRDAALSAKDRDGDTALLIAAWYNHGDIVRFLLDAKADVQAANNCGGTALHLAASKGHLRSAELLVAAGASLDVKNNYRGRRNTPLEEARFQRHQDMVKLLESAAQKKVGAKAATGGYTAKVPEAKPSAAPITAKAKSGAEPPAADASPTRKATEAAMSEEADRAAAAERKNVLVAAYNGDLPAVRHFVQKNRTAALRKKNEDGRTALMCAANRDHGDVVHFLIEAKADVDVASNDGRTALHRAACLGHLRSAELLVAAGASLDVKTKEGKTPLDLARQFKKQEVVKLLESAAQKKVEAKAATGGYAAEAKPSAAPITAKAHSHEAPVADAPTTPKASEAIDIRKKKWFNTWEQKVFSEIQTWIEAGASGVVVMGVKPEREHAMTLWEWPALQEDLRHAYAKQAYPFFEHGKEVILFRNLKFEDVTIDELSEELEHQTRKNRSVIVASCCTDHMDEVKECLLTHNQRNKKGHGKASRCYGTAEDFQT